MKHSILVSLLIAIVSAILCIYAFIAVEPDFFVFGVWGLLLAGLMLLVIFLIKYIRRRSQETVPCVQCGVMNKRFAMRFGRCIKCREQNQAEANKAKQLRLEKKRALALETERILAEQSAAKRRELQRGESYPAIPEGQVATRLNQDATALSVSGQVGNIAVCPKCKSPSIQMLHRGYSGGAGACGCCLLGPLGLLFGAFGSSGTSRHCLNCNNRW